MAGRKQLHAVGLVLALALVPACGSTVQLKGNQVIGGSGGTTGAVDSLGQPTGPQGSTGLTPGGSTGLGSTGAAGGSTSGGSTSGTTGGSSSGGATGSFGATGGGSGRNAQGITATKVYVGFIDDRNAGAVNKAVGVGSITSGNSHANTDAIIKDINAHGGLGGRTLVPVWAPFDSTSAQTLDQQFAAVCQTFTRDNHVFAVDGGGQNTSYKQCLTKAGVLILSSDLPDNGAQEMARWPGLIEQGYPNLDRLASYYLKPLVDQKYFTPWNTVSAAPAPAGTVKVGILTYDDPVFKRVVDGILVPGLKQLGYTPVVARIAKLSRAADAGSQSAAIQSAELSFASNGVTHVIPFESNGNLSTFFLPTARSQGYYPRYGVYTASASEALLESGVVEAKQFNGAVGFGWVPGLDLPSRLNPANGRYSNANRRYCLKVMKDNGITFDSGNAEGIALNTCTNLYLLKAVLDKRPAQITLSSTVAAIESLGRSYQRAGGVGEGFAPGRRDPLDRGYYWKYDGGCSCFTYFGSPITIP